ncbi:two-component regulator propeller domain-containing protein [Gramella sp. KN1008]|uniref:two-component regulator propeller domain-containing protein n=1 Tax=Gramella sp. KN1008 TaxID=2529298 RepID=UPI001039EFC2|nr:two-component regulator propeller domain-containing protein [Gramella sp. KN1008]TBW26553.1 hypothetical protein EZJ28_14220 [Gramella sp. KN1008]
MQIEVPEASTVYSMYGSLQNELIIGGLGNIFKTTNKGVNWSIVQNDITAYELREKQDSIFAIALYNSTYKDFYTLDNGDSWHLHNKKSLQDLRTRSVTTSKGITYLVVSSETFPKQPDIVLRSNDGGSTWVDIFPYKHSIYSIYLDSDDNLYLGTNDWEWDETADTFDTNNKNNIGIIYVLND